MCPSPQCFEDMRDNIYIYMYTHTHVYMYIAACVQGERERREKREEKREKRKERREKRVFSANPAAVGNNQHLALKSISSPAPPTH